MSRRTRVFLLVFTATLVACLLAAVFFLDPSVQETPALRALLVAVSVALSIGVAIVATKEHPHE